LQGIPPDFFFCPMLANDLGVLFLRMLDAGLGGFTIPLEANVSASMILAAGLQTNFGFDRRSDQPEIRRRIRLLGCPITDAYADTDKLAKAIKTSLPGLILVLLKFKAQYLDGYRAQIMNMSEG